MVDITSLTMSGELARLAYPDVTVTDGFPGSVMMESIARVLLSRRNEKLFISRIHHDSTADILAYIEEAGRFTVVKASAEDIASIEPRILGSAKIKALTAPAKFVEKAIKRTCYCVCVPERKMTVVYISSVNSSITGLLASMLPAFLPWAFSEAPLDSEEKEMLLAASHTDYDCTPFIEKIEALTAKYYDLQTAAKQVYLKDFESSLHSVMVRELQNKLEQIMRNITNYTRELSGQYEQKSRCELELVGLSNAEPQSGALMEYFKANKKLFVIDCRNSNTIRYIVSGYMDLFDPDTYRLFRDNPSSYIHSAYRRVCEPTITKAEYILLMDALFDTETLRLKMCSAWELSPTSIGPIEHFAYPVQFADYMPNSHLDRYGCMGSFRSYLHDSLMNHDYVMVVDTTSQESGNINLNDNVVIPSEFIPNLCRSKRKIIELPDGTSVTPKDAVEYLKTGVVNSGEDN